MGHMCDVGLWFCENVFSCTVFVAEGRTEEENEICDGRWTAVNECWAEMGRRKRQLWHGKSQGYWHDGKGTTGAIRWDSVYFQHIFCCSLLLLLCIY